MSICSMRLADRLVADDACRRYRPTRIARRRGRRGAAPCRSSADGRARPRCPLAAWRRSTDDSPTTARRCRCARRSAGWPSGCGRSALVTLGSIDWAVSGDGDRDRGGEEDEGAHGVTLRGAAARSMQGRNDAHISSCSTMPARMARHVACTRRRWERLSRHRHDDVRPRWRDCGRRWRAGSMSRGGSAMTPAMRWRKSFSRWPAGSATRRCCGSACSIPTASSTPPSAPPSSATPPRPSLGKPRPRIERADLSRRRDPGARASVRGRFLPGQPDLRLRCRAVRPAAGRLRPDACRDRTPAGAGWCGIPAAGC